MANKWRGWEPRNPGSPVLYFMPFLLPLSLQIAACKAQHSAEDAGPSCRSMFSLPGEVARTGVRQGDDFKNSDQAQTFLFSSPLLLAIKMKNKKAYSKDSA